MTVLPSAYDIYAELLRVARRQIATTPQGKSLAATYPSLLDELVQAICGNAALAVREQMDAANDVIVAAATRQRAAANDVAEAIQSRENIDFSNVELRVLANDHEQLRADVAVLEQQVEQLTKERDDARQAALDSAFAGAKVFADRLSTELGHSELDADDSAYCAKGLDQSAWLDALRAVGGL